jgi:hypothetical protein
MTSTNLRVNGEVPRKRRPADKEQYPKGPGSALDSQAGHGVHGVVEDGTVRKWCELSRESLRGAETEFMTRKRPKSCRSQEVRVPIVVKKRSNDRGAKGHRKMEAP